MPNERSSSPAQRALWFVENRLSDELTLHGVAEDVGVSPHHLARAFGAATGCSLRNYARGRRLTEAVRRLVDGDASILAVALDHGYGSHGAFTRAFRDEFGVTPEAFRRNPAQYALRLTEPVQMDKSKLIDLDPPRFENGERLIVVGRNVGARRHREHREGLANVFVCPPDACDAKPRLARLSEQPFVLALPLFVRRICEIVEAIGWDEATARGELAALRTEVIDRLAVLSRPAPTPLNEIASLVDRAHKGNFGCGRDGRGPCRTRPTGNH